MNALTEIPARVTLQSRIERFAVWWSGAAAAVLWPGAAVLTWQWPDADDLGRTGLLASLALALAATLAAAACVSSVRGLPPSLARLGPWLIALALGLAGWELVTAKLDLLPRPFFAAPQSMLEVLTDDWPRLGVPIRTGRIDLVP